MPKPSSIVVVVATLLVWLPDVASACSVCASSDVEANRAAFIGTTAFLSFFPLAIVGGFVWWLRRRARELEAERSPTPVSRASSSP